MARSADPHLSIVQGQSGAEFEALYAIYVRALPVRERKTRDDLIRMLVQSGYVFWVARKANRIVGFAIVFASPSVDLALLEYLAVEEEVRSSGIGSALFQHVQASCATSGKPILVEVESDRIDASDRELRARRKGFYRKLGCREIRGLKYVMPLAGIGPPPAMELLVWGSDTGAISTAQVREWLQAIYTEVYGCSPDDPRIENMLFGKGPLLRVT